MRLCKCDKPTCYYCMAYQRDPVFRAFTDAKVGLLGKAVNLLVACVKFVASGFARAPRRELQARLKSCGACEQNVDGTCRQCGCLVTNKATWKSESCPLGKWPCCGS